MIGVLLLLAACRTEAVSDADGDGYAAAAIGGEDCDDLDPEVNPGAEERPYDGLDNDCSAQTPDDDLDGDGYGVAEDCDDTDASVGPQVPLDGPDGRDEDCDYRIDEDAPDTGGDSAD